MSNNCMRMKTIHAEYFMIYNYDGLIVEESISKLFKKFKSDEYIFFF